MSQIFHPYKFKEPKNLNIFFPCALSSTQIEPKKPKRSQIDPHLDHEIGVHILLVDLPVGDLFSEQKIELP